MKPILVSEIFLTIQGEGALVGRPTVFVRTGGCDFRCCWCDTLYAVLPEHRASWQPMAAQQIVDEIFRLTNDQPILVTLSGGNPALQPLQELLQIGHERGLTFALETQGSKPREWFSRLDHLVLSPKPPSSLMETDWPALRECARLASGVEIVWKIVVFDEADYLFARQVRENFPRGRFFLQPGNAATQASDEFDVAGLATRTEWLLARAMQDGWLDATILPQVHTLLWGNKRGV